MGHERHTFATGKGYFHFAPTLYTVCEPVNSQTLVSQANRNNMGGAGGSLVGKKMEELLIVKFFFTFFFFTAAWFTTACKDFIISNARTSRIDVLICRL